MIDTLNFHHIKLFHGNVYPVITELGMCIEALILSHGLCLGWGLASSFNLCAFFLEFLLQLLPSKVQ